MTKTFGCADPFHPAKSVNDLKFASGSYEVGNTKHALQFLKRIAELHSLLDEFLRNHLINGQAPDPQDRKFVISYLRLLKPEVPKSNKKFLELSYLARIYLKGKYEYRYNVTLPPLKGGSRNIRIKSVDEQT